MDAAAPHESLIQGLNNLVVKKDKEIVALKEQVAYLRQEVSHYRLCMMGITNEIEKLTLEMNSQTGTLEINLKGMANVLIHRKEMCATLKEIIKRQEGTIEKLTQQLTGPLKVEEVKREEQ